MRQYRKYWLFLVPITAAAVVTFYLFFKPLPVVAASPEANVPVQVYGLGTVEARILSRIGFQALGTLAGLADEPTAALDSERAGVVMDLLRTVAVEQEAAIVVVTHDEKIFPRLDRIFHLRDGVLETEESMAANVA